MLKLDSTAGVGDCVIGYCVMVRGVDDQWEATCEGALRPDYGICGRSGPWRNFGPVAFSIVLCFFPAGCGTFNRGAWDRVAVVSVPAGAQVQVDGTVRGTTPLEVELRRNAPHEVRLDLEGYRNAVEYVAPTATPRGKRDIRIGPLEEAGYYDRLVPNPVKVELSPNLVPDRPGPDPYAEFSERVVKADALLREGRISASEHAYIVARLIAFYEAAPKGSAPGR